ncbi:hypothetical protein GCM10010486_39990 [Nonomuraea roseoviolacea subsp. carminata]
MVALTGCSGEDGAGPEQPPAEPPELVLARELIADKERVIGLYGVLIGKGAGELAPFRDRHQAHLTELRRRFPAAASPAPGATQSSGTPSPGASSPAASSPGAPTAGAAKVSLSSLREVERKAAAQRARRLSGIAPSMAQLVASIGACEAAHALALPRSL